METLRKQIDALIKFDDLAEVLAKSDPLKQKRAQLAKDCAKLEKDMRDSERNLSAAYTHHLEGLLDLREYELVRAKLEREKTEADARIAWLRSEQRKYDTHTALDNPWLVKFRAFRDCEAPTREMLQALIERSVLEPMTYEVEIHWGFTDAFENLQELMRESGCAE